VAKLGRLGYVATPFAGNVPAFDVLIADEKGRSIPIQVKAIRGGGWQFRIDEFLNIEIVDNEQRVKGKRKLSHPDLVCVFVVLSDDENDQYYVFRQKELQAFFRRTYKGGRRPRKPQSLHCAVWPKHLQRFKDNWGLIEEALKGV